MRRDTVSWDKPVAKTAPALPPLRSIVFHIVVPPLHGIRHLAGGYNAENPLYLLGVDSERIADISAVTTISS